ncbi:putative N-acetylated-alpha-linked acidic dipeptidase [Amphibalanus amphitrite]|uniref:Putative N-acetylated-alpha-linked acidic dipeptidase n=1 Tax=Amphibalanus amphitrite TaxID=1232801 RepID=A0A6A4VZH6_AMPAM|nr:putative N-acetylated-alpha-linked acidic dipeptidase [Amphibalanus amphitrite]
MERVMPTYNTLGFIRGSVEPDRYVVLGNHRDAWSYGSLDPCSGTATMMEMVRAFSLLKQNGWRPRRTLVFASWGSGEFGYYGATELVEEFITLIGGRTVAYLNVDLAIIYTYNLFVVATPLLQNVTAEAAKQVAAPDPSLGFSSLYDHWRSREKGDLFSYNLGSPSEHWSFYQLLGTPIVYMMWEIDYDRWNWVDFPLYHAVFFFLQDRWNWVDFPLYHTPFETYEAMQHLDPTFAYHLALGRLWAVVGLLLADRPLLPLDVRDVRKPLRLGLDQLTAAHGDFMKAYNVSLAGLERAVAAYEEAAEQFHNVAHSGEPLSDLHMRQLNDQMVLVERSFVDPNGLLVDDQNRNAVFGTDPDHEYNGLLFPDVAETLAAARLQPHQAELWRRVHRALAAAVFVVNAAGAALREPTRFARPWEGPGGPAAGHGQGRDGGDCRLSHSEL